MCAPSLTEPQPPSPSASHWRGLAHPALICALLTAATVTFFWPVTGASFIGLDDQEFVASNPRIQQGLTLAGFRWAFATVHTANWHPLTWLSHMLDVQAFGEGPAGPHSVNLALHAANAILLFLALRKLTGAQWPSAMVAALFALHPLHVESVAWVSERKDVLSTFFFILTLRAYTAYASRLSSPAISRRFSILHPPAALCYVLALVFFAFGLMSKPMLVTLPFVLLLLDYWPLRRLQLFSAGSTLWPVLRDKIPFLLLAAFCSVITLFAQRVAIETLARLPLHHRLANALVSCARYIGKTLWPAGLALPYPHPGHWPALQVALAAILIAGLSYAAWRARRNFPFLFIGWFWFCGTLVPVLGLVQVGSQAMADRYTYVPLIGLFIMMSWGAAEIARRWPLPKAAPAFAAVAVLLVLGVVTRAQAKRWRDGETLFRHAIAVTKDNFVALQILGNTLFDKGKLNAAENCVRQSLRIRPKNPEALVTLGVVLEARDINQAADCYRKALEIDPTHQAALRALGTVLLNSKQFSESIKYLEAAVNAQPDDFRSRNNLGNALRVLGKTDEAIAQLRLALKAAPNSAGIQKNLALTLASKGQFAEAVAHYRQALALEPNDAETHAGLGQAFGLQRNWDEAVRELSEAVRLDPANAQAQLNLGRALAAQGHIDTAIPHLAEAARLMPESPLAHYLLARALAQAGRRQDAITHLNEALRLKPDYQQARQALRALAPTAD